MVAVCLKRISILVVLLVACGARAGILDPLDVRAKTEAPLETDQPGYEVILLDSHSDTLLVMGSIRVPDTFGKVDIAALSVVNSDGQKIAEVGLAPSVPPKKTPSFEFSLRREFLKNSTVSVAHNTPDSMDVALFHLGTFEVREPKVKRELPPRKFRVELVEQGMFDEVHQEFTLTDKVPLAAEQSYGVRLYVHGGGGSLPVRTELTLPSPPKTWGSEEEVKRLKISDDGRTASYADRLPTDELVRESWTVAEGDPAGDYELKIFLRDELVKTFVFHVQPPLAESKQTSSDTK